MTKIKKYTQTELFQMIKEVFATSDHPQATEICDFADTQIQHIADKAEKAKARAAKKRAEGDALKTAVREVLNFDDYMNIDEISEEILIEGVTRAKITSRLSTLAKEGVVEKATVLDENKRKVMGYKLVNAEEDN